MIQSGQVKSGQVMSGQVMSGQVKSGQVQNFFGTNILLDPTIFCSQNLFGPKMHLRMEFDSGVGPTCPTYLGSSSRIKNCYMNSASSADFITIFKFIIINS